MQDRTDAATTLVTIAEQDILNALREVLDPELGVNVVDLGLVYSTEVSGRDVRVVMTMTTPACPLHSYLREAAIEAIRGLVPEAGQVSVEIVWEPKWNPMMMSQAAKRQLGWR